MSRRNTAPMSSSVMKSTWISVSSPDAVTTTARMSSVAKLS